MGRSVIAGGRVHTGLRNFAHILRPEIRVALELVPGLMERELRDLVNLIASLEQTAGGFVPHVVETQILDPEHVAGAGEGGTYALRVIREDVLARLRLCLDDRPRLRRVFESPVIAVLVGRVLGVANNASACCGIVVVPFEPADLGLASSGADREFHDGKHADSRALIPMRKILAQPCEFIRRRPPHPPARFADQTQFPARVARQLHDLGEDRQFFDTASGSQDDADPDQVICHGGRSGAFSAPRANVIDQHRGGQVHGVHLAERMALQEFEMGLLAALPFGDRLERLDIPTDQLGERGRSLLLTDKCGGIFECNLAMSGPAQRRSSMRESLAFPVNDRPTTANADDCRIARDAIGLFAGFDSGHDGVSGRQAILVSFTSPRQPINAPECTQIPQKRAALKAL